MSKERIPQHLEKKSTKDKVLEFSQLIDKAGIVTGVAMMVFGATGAGLLLAGGSLGTYYLAEKLKKK
jgi:hypothetical protein